MEGFCPPKSKKRILFPEKECAELAPDLYKNRQVLTSAVELCEV